MNILLIEDEKDLAETGKTQLEMMGHTVDTAFDIAEARSVVDKSASKPIHLVIADHRLPDGLGIDYVIELRQQMTNCAFVIVSGCLTDDDIARIKDCGIPYFRKPLLYRKVVERMQKDLLAGKPVAEIEKALEQATVEDAPAAGDEGADTEVLSAPKKETPGFWARLFGKKGG